MSLTMKIVLSIGVLVVVSIGAAFLVLDPVSKSSESGKEAETANADELDSIKIVESDNKNKIDVSSIPTETKFQNMIHHMSHQKVEAGEKWGALQITEERIDKLITILEKADYKHTNVYEEILTDWSEGNFEGVVEDHNDIWRLQGGTVGKATGKLTPAEEQEYILKHFR